MNYYNEIKEKLIKSEIYDRAKDYSKDRHKVSVYFEITVFTVFFLCLNPYA